MRTDLFADSIIEPMEKNHFDRTTKFIGKKKQKPNTVKAARMVLVDHKSPAEALRKYPDVSPETLSRAIARYPKKWEELCRKAQLVNKTWAVPPQFAKLIDEIEASALAQLDQKTRGGKVADESAEADVD